MSLTLPSDNMEDGLSCYACSKHFSMSKHLHAHEATCKEKKRFAIDVLQAQKHLSKAKRKHHKTGSLSRRGSLVKDVYDSRASLSPCLQLAQRYSADYFNNEIGPVCSPVVLLPIVVTIYLYGGGTPVFFLKTLTISQTIS